ncbi:hypothetical protein [Amycolatopsis sp. cmx-4-61]
MRAIAAELERPMATVGREPRRHRHLDGAWPPEPAGARWARPGSAN